MRVKAFAGTGKTFTLLQYAHAQIKEQKKRVLYMVFNKALQQETEAKGRAMRLGYSFQCKTYNTAAYYYLHYHEHPLRVKLGRGKGSNNRDYSQDDTTRSSQENQADGNMSLTGAHVKEILGNEYRDFESRVQFEDATEAILDVLEGQNVGLILVGDPHQQLYRWRGAVDAMEKANSKRIKRDLTLSTSFRFGYAVAGVANALLSLYKNERTPVLGYGWCDTMVVGNGASYAQESRQVTIVCRSNRGVFEQLCANHRAGKRVCIKGNVKLDTFSRQFDDVYVVYKGKQPSKSFKHKTRSWIALVRTAEEEEDGDLLSMIAMVMELGDEVQHLLQAFQDWKKQKVRGRDADVICSTVRQLKGQEFEHVRIHTDFNELCNDDEGEGLSSFRWKRQLEEVNCLYVAATRARRILELSPDVHLFLLRYAGSRYTVEHVAPSTVCTQCTNPHTRGLSVVAKRPDLVNWPGKEGEGSLVAIKIF